MSSRLRRTLLAAALGALACLALPLPGAAAAGPPGPTRLVSTPGKIVPLPASVPHEAGDMVDRRIVPDLIWIARRYPIYVTDGYSGPLPDGQHIGCDECHARNSDHYNGLAVDLVPLGGGTKCDVSWEPITALAEWAEPVQGAPVLPFRWVGYNGDAGHGCGNHLHLSWNHTPAAMFTLAESVEVFPVTPGEATETAPTTPRSPRAPAIPTPPAGPSGGISRTQTGGIGAHGATGPPPGFGD